VGRGKYTGIEIGNGMDGYGTGYCMDMEMGHWELGTWVTGIVEGERIGLSGSGDRGSGIGNRSGSGIRVALALALALATVPVLLPVPRDERQQQTRATENVH
jgi:hypothetical protein